MTPEEAAYCVLRDFDRRDPEVERIMTENDRRLDEQHARLMREDPAYAARWHAGLKAMADEIDDRIAAEVYRDTFPPPAR